MYLKFYCSTIPWFEVPPERQLLAARKKQAGYPQTQHIIPPISNLCQADKDTSPNATPSNAPDLSGAAVSAMRAPRAVAASGVAGSSGAVARSAEKEASEEASGKPKKRNRSKRKPAVRTLVLSSRPKIGNSQHCPVEIWHKLVLGNVTCRLLVSSMPEL